MTFLNNRTACISLHNYTGPALQIHRGVPQGSSISPTLYALYTHDIPAPTPGFLNISYSDYITQIITQPVKSRRVLAKKIEREIRKINEFERKWKIKTNTTKFTVIPLAIKKTHPIAINGPNIPYSKEGKILGMSINTQGIHIKRSASAVLSTIKRFYRLSTKIKTHLVKACVLPIITYPTFPFFATYKTTVLSLRKNK